MMAKDKPTQIVLVITSFTALMNNHEEQCRESQVPVRRIRSVEQGKQGSQHKIFLVSEEVAEQAAFRQWVDHLDSQGQLARVFIDEAHVPLINHRWRQELGPLKMLQGLDVPMVLMTATMPPTWTEHLNMWYVNISGKYRTCTLRRNLIFHMHKVCNVLEDDSKQWRGKDFDPTVTDPRLSSEVHGYITLSGN